MRHFTFMLCLLWAQSLFSQVFINEISASNATVIENTAFTDFNDWIELYNSNTVAVDVSGYFLTDNASDTTKWALPLGTSIAPNGFLLVWADGNNTALHTSYSLTRSGEELALYAPDGTLIDFVAFGEQQTDISFGRQTNGSAVWGYFTTPTPNTSNNGSAFFSGFTPYEPIVRPKGGFYTNPLKVGIENVAGVGVVRYTTNGSYPTQTSAIYTDSISISQTTVVKARVFMPNQIPGPIVTNTYFVNEHFETRNLPVVSLSTNPDYFWDADIGLYVQNFKPDWEYPVHVEFYEADGLLGFEHDMGVKLDGENSWELPQKLLALSSRKQYSTVNTVTYQIFPETQRTQYENLLLRCSGNDWANTLFRDGMQQNLTQPDMDLDCQFFRACIVYVNGQYLGIHNLRNKPDEEYLEQKYGVSQDAVDMISNEGVVEAGTDVAYTALQNRLTTGVQQDTAFAKLEKMMDVTEYTDYIISEMFGANTSWGHNIMAWKTQSDSALFRWLLFDYDRGFFTNNVGDIDMSFFTATNGAAWSNPPWATLPLRRMLQNTNYEQRFISRFADCLYTTYHPTSINRRIDKFAGNIRNELPYHANRWGGTTSSYGDGIVSTEFWEGEVQQLRQFADGRNAYLYTDLDNFFNLSGIVNLQLATSGANQGLIRFNHQNIMPDAYRLGKYFRNLPFTLSAEPKIGYTFVQWQTIATQNTTLFAAETEWKYSDATTAPPDNWMQATFDDATWASGNAQLGYGDNDEATTLSYGSNTNNKTPAYYFRKTFTVDEANFSNNLQLRLIADDGAIVYLNGTEVVRYNMPSGAINFNTLANNTVSNPTENTPQVFTIAASLLQVGTNTIAVEVHQADLSSSDVSFDADLSGIISGTPTFYSDSSTISLNLSNDVYLQALFAPTGVCVLPDTVSSNLNLTAACSPYYAQGNVVVNPNVSVTIDEGVEIRMPQDASLFINGNLQINGSAAAGVIITPNANIGATNWGGILFRNTNALSQLRYLTLDKASRGTHQPYNKAAISAYRANLLIDHLTALNVIDNPIFARYSNVTLTNSQIQSQVTGDCINVKQGFAVTENCTFAGGTAVDMDAIDYDGITDGVVRNCIIHDFRGDNNDGLDIGEECHNLLIENNFIYRCFDKGVSCGQESSATLQHNTIADCTIGVALKDLSPVSINHCTFHGNQIAISGYEKNPGYKGGIGTISNCILSNSAEQAWYADSTATVNITYSLSDTEELSGTGNISANPLFVDAPHYQFAVQPTSPIINTANDGSNMGSNYFAYQVPSSPIMLSEFLYNDDADSDKEFVELYNPTNQTVDLSGYALSEAIDFTFPAGTNILPNGYVVVARNTSMYPNVTAPMYQWSSGKLANEGERIVLNDGFGMLVDFVRYGNSAPWADTLQTLNLSLELIKDTLDNHFYSSWQLSINEGGTPGNDVIITALPLPYPNNMVQLQLYPNPTNGYVVLKSNELFGQQTAFVVDVMGQIVLSQALPTTENKTNLWVGNLPNGVYFVQLGNDVEKLVISGK